jgi:transcriptional regulator with PAS, ATPase and Fis domain
MGYSYPGNVRELINILKAMVALAHPGEVLDVHLVPEKLLGSGGGNLNDLMDSTLQEGKMDLRNTVDEFTKRLILRVLDGHQGNVPRAAEQLNVTPFGLRKMMKRLGIER